jgi:hypothetical protein
VIIQYHVQSILTSLSFAEEAEVYRDGFGAVVREMSISATHQSPVAQIAAIEMH